MLSEPNRREVSPRSALSQHTSTPQHSISTSLWTRRLIILLTILAAIGVAILLGWGASYIVTALLIFTVASLIAYAIIPVVDLFQRVMPRALAIVAVYVIVLGLLGLILYFIIKTMVTQLSTLAQSIAVLLQPGKDGQASPLVKILNDIGISNGQIQNVASQLSSQLTSFAGTVAGGILPIIGGVASSLVNMLLTVVISIYLLVDGARAIKWLRNRTPVSQRGYINSIISVLQHVVGGYIRGQFTLCLIIGTIVGVGMAVLGLSSYAILLGVLSFVTEFIPVLGTIICGVVAVLLALTQGWVTAVLVLAYFILVHIFEGYILAPRLIGKAVGLHPVVSLMALTIGGELFGPWGAIFASPLGGLLQAFAVAFWIHYRRTHSDEFPPDQDAISGNTSTSEDLFAPPSVPAIKAGDSPSSKE
ncbi:MAG TPA: AI-2E family transporter [Ktedonobacteraceae bacterium]|nr:AI-2E family transporter [Ktedonobacteraceae bacterium]